MDGIHDVGGMHGFGPVPLCAEDYVFCHPWQRKAFGLTQALAGNTPFCADQHRHKIELLPPADYLGKDYFERWAIATGELLKDAGLATERELATGQMDYAVDLARHAPIEADALLLAMKQGAHLKFPEVGAAPEFQIGMAVFVKPDAPSGHTRVPRYVRSRLGTIKDDLGMFRFADAAATGRISEQQRCYTVSFDVETLWGHAAEQPGDEVLLDLAEAYLEHA